jgi:TM2 domain-containing membrane protein YozV/DNA-directed RNA polymerase subunit RPC12/RpoP
MKKQMDNNQTGRRNINLTKDDSQQNRPIREARPIYRTNVDEESLERREYRNISSPQQQPQYRTSGYHDQRETLYDDPPPAMNNYGVPPAARQVQNPPAYQNDDLSRYYDYDEPAPAPIPTPAPPPQQMPIPQPVPMHPPVQQQAMKFCKYCGERIPADAVVCTHCGRQVEELKASGTAMNNVNISNNTYNNAPAYESLESDKFKSTSAVLAALGFFGLGGLHRFYLGKPGTAILYLLTGGLCGLGTFIDLILIATGKFTDGNGKLVKK